MTEIEQLREELARLRERVAVLECGARWEYKPPQVIPVVPWTPTWPSPHWVSPSVTC
jgi:hypothetical protein